MKFLRTTLALMGGVAILMGSADAKDRQELAAISVPDLGLRVVSACIGKTVSFELTNTGDAWPAVGAIMIIKASDRSVLNRRNMRLAQGQKASFKLIAERNPGGEIALYVAPTWFVREFTFDARISCD
ncbi:MAG: hypothetical protein RBS99_15245 [Rhodospirillales bacterium]|jgi:hypothetical protein|nr:hypothetical protein [Rhodospirillales bacterium]